MRLKAKFVVCNRNPDPSEEWKNIHEPNCTINHTGSSGSMECGTAVVMLLNIKCGPNMIKGLRMQNKIPLQNSRLKATEKYRSRRQKLRSLRKSKISNKSYISGVFSRNIKPDNILCT